MPDAVIARVIRGKYAPLVLPALFALGALLVQLAVGAYGTDRGQTGDEAAHFVTSLMLSDYLGHLGANPVAFAKSYYVHLPRVAIGHWPPFFEILQSLMFDIFGGSNIVAMALQAVIAGLLAGLPAALMARHLGLVAGVLTGLVILLNPIVLFQIDTDMADNLLGLLVFLTACAWSCYYHRRSAIWAAAFAAVASAAILTKGTALGLLLLPAVYVGIKRDWRFLLDRRTVLAYAAILALSVPWYAATYRMAANGWNYSWGSFTLIAIPFFSKALVVDFGIPCTLGFLFGVVRILRGRGAGSLDMAVFAAAAAVQFGFILLVPADLQPRYLVPVYPAAAMVAVWGISGLLDTVLRGALRRPAITALTALLVLISIATSFGSPHVESFRTGQAFARIAPAKNPLILISGSSRFEGAMIATVAQADRGRFFYALRASKLLSSSSFMGGAYRPRFTDPGEMKAWLIQNRIGWIVIDNAPESMGYAHNAMLLAILRDNPKMFHPVWRGARGAGATLLFETPAASVMPQHMDALLAEQAPAGVP